MKIECAKDKLKESILLVERITGKNLSLPILESILIETKDNSLILKATNLDIGLEIKVPAKVEKNGKIAVPGHLLANFLQLLGEDNVIKLESINDNLSISTKRNSTLIKSYPTDEFPIIPRMDEEEFLNIDSDKLLSGIRSVSYASSMSDIKPEIASVYMYFSDGDLVFVSTDSFRLAERKFDLKKKGDFSGVIIPIKNASEMLRIFENTSGELKISLNKNQITIISPSIYFTSRIVGGVFPDYRQIIPKDKKTEIVALKRDIIDSIKISSIFSDKFNQINVKIFPSEGLFEISSRNQDKGESVTKIEATVEGDDVDINLNAKYLLDCFQSIPEDSISFSLNGPSKPIIIKGIGNQSFTYLVMPMIK